MRECETSGIDEACETYPLFVYFVYFRLFRILSSAMAGHLPLNGVDAAYQRGYQEALAIKRLTYKLAGEQGDQLVMANILINAGRIYGYVGAPEKSHELAMGGFVVVGDGN
jgi:hypothetical protein